jgi:hypothetical protein
VYAQIARTNALSAGEGAVAERALAAAEASG